MTKTTPPSTPTAAGRAKLPPAMLANLQQLGYLTMAPIQAEILPITLADDRPNLLLRDLPSLVCYELVIRSWK